MSSIKVSSWSDFSMLLRFLSKVILMFNLLLCLNQLIPTKRSSYLPLHLSGIVLYSFTSLDLVISGSHLLFFSLEPFLFFSYCPTRLLSKSVCTPTPFVTACTAFSVFFQFAWNRFLSWPWSALPSVSFFRPLFFSIAHGLLRRRLKCSSVLIFSGLFCFLYLSALLQPRFIRKRTPSLLSRTFWDFFFDLRFPERKVIVFFSPFHHIGMCYIPFAFSNHFSLDPLILSIYPFHLSIFFFIYFIFASSFLSFHSWSLMFPSRQHQGFTFILSSTLPLCLTSLFSLFYLDDDYTYLSPSNIYYPYMHLWWIILYTFLAAVIIVNLYHGMNVH